jgi:hypothetical protein
MPSKSIDGRARRKTSGFVSCIGRTMLSGVAEDFPALVRRAGDG